MIHTTRPADNRHFLDPFELQAHLDEFCAELASVGYRHLTIRGYVDSICHFGTWLHRNKIALRSVNATSMDKFSAHRCSCPGGRRQRSLSVRYVNRVRRFVRFLVDRQHVDPLPAIGRQVPSAIHDAFGDWLLNDRGLSTTTIATYLRSLEPVLADLGANPKAYSASGVRAVVRAHAEQFGPTSAKHVVSALRAYLRFLATKGLCRAALVEAVPTIPHWRLSSLPRYVGTSELERIVESCDTSTAMGLRDRAILMLLARLGLRAGDIVELAIADIDWNDATVRVCGKSRREVRLPLPQDAGDAILSYLERGRPKVTSPQLFLCMTAPYRSLGRSSTVSAIVKAAVVRAQIVDPPSSGTNLMRHSAATALLRAGASLDAVSTVLRHRSPDTTMHYAKVDVVRLRALAIAWPESASC